MPLFQNDVVLHCCGLRRKASELQAHSSDEAGASVAVCGRKRLARVLTARKQLKPLFLYSSIVNATRLHFSSRKLRMSGRESAELLRCCSRSVQASDLRIPSSLGVYALRSKFINSSRWGLMLRLMLHLDGTIVSRFEAGTRSVVSEPMSWLGSRLELGFTFWCRDHALSWHL